MTTTTTTEPSPLATPPSDVSLPGSAPAAGSEPRRMGAFRRIVAEFSPRRQYVINREKQLRSAFLVVVVVLLLLVPLNYSLHTVRQQETATITAANPELGPLMASRDRTELIVGLLASLVIMAGVFALTIIETHRTSGAAFAIRRRIDLVREGRLDAKLHLRGGDNLRELEAPFNAMVEALRRQTIEEADALDAIANQVAGIIVPQEAHNLAARLRQLARRRREGAGLA